jgi:homoserine dehydrogenase
VVRLLRENARDIEARLGAPLELAHIVVRNPDAPRDPAVPADLLRSDAATLLGDDSVRIVVEVIGGYEPARGYVREALASGKHVVTANKALLSRHGDELAQVAASSGCDLYFEGAVGGGIPIIRSLREALASDRIDRIAAIINGTSNFVLTAMADKGHSFDEAVREAQRLGYAEADASLDTGGHDAAQKLALMVALAFGLRVQPEQIHRDGIERIGPTDIDLARRFGYAIRPVALAAAEGEFVEAGVFPALVPLSGLLASVTGVFNAVHIHSYALGPALFYGQGAGMMPTAVSVVSDIIEAGRNVLLGASGRLPHMAFHEGLGRARRLRPHEEAHSAWYLRLSVQDQPGVLARVAGLLGQQGISIRQLVQTEPDADAKATLALLTHGCSAGALFAALAQIDALGTTVAPTNAVRIVEA